MKPTTTTPKAPVTARKPITKPSTDSAIKKEGTTSGATTPRPEKKTLTTSEVSATGGSKIGTPKSNVNKSGSSTLNKSATGSETKIGV